MVVINLSMERNRRSMPLPGRIIPQGHYLYHWSARQQAGEVACFEVMREGTDPCEKFKLVKRFLAN